MQLTLDAYLLPHLFTSWSDLGKYFVLSTEDKEFITWSIPFPSCTLTTGRANPSSGPCRSRCMGLKGKRERCWYQLLCRTMDLDIQRNLAHLGAYDMLQELKANVFKQANRKFCRTVREISHLQAGGSESYLSLSKQGFYQLRAEFQYARHGERPKGSETPKKNKPHKAGEEVRLKERTRWAHALYNVPFAPKLRISPPPKKGLNPAKTPSVPNVVEVGHGRRRNCSVTSWVYDTGCGTHICISAEGLRGSRKLKPEALSLYVGDGHRAAVEAIGEFHLCLPSGLVLILHNCHYAPSITRGIISVSRLYKDGFVNRFENDNTISVSRNNLVYFCAIPRDDIYKIDLSSYNTNDSSMYAVSNKRAKLNLDSTLLWHCRLGHISKKCIEKLQHDGLLNSTDIKSFEKCVSCMSRKMARKPYSYQVERAKDLLGLIHTDVCGLFKIVSRQGESYFVTFTDDFSHYGYVYLLKHKHEVFETFKVFQKEVENQLGKTIKSLRSDRGGEYMSQEFLDHLKEHGIIAHRTPPYTPQHNGMSERRNRTLLDMVRSMMSQTTLPKSLWDYSLESAACILNMVSTKKVEKTPYEVWHGQAPKLSYLKVWGCEALVKRDTLTKPDKLEPRSIKCIFVGYPKETMEYSFYYPPENKVFVARNAEFFENSLITQEASGSLEEDLHPSIDTSLNHEEDDQEASRSLEEDTHPSIDTSLNHEEDD
ncbi:retrotransposon protein, putative, ty1-copia subclass [Tanacetum coccineum]